MDHNSEVLVQIRGLKWPLSRNCCIFIAVANDGISKIDLAGTHKLWLGRLIVPSCLFYNNYVNF